MGDIIPAEKVATLTGHKPKAGDEAVLVTDKGRFWGKVEPDLSFKLVRSA